MPLNIPSTNGHLTSEADLLTDLVVRLHKEKPDDTFLFGLFAQLSREVGRNDLHSEFTHRAVASAPALPSPPHTPNPEAERHHQHGCRLIREGKFTEAETVFREAIRLDPKYADAHGNLCLPSR